MKLRTLKDMEGGRLIDGIVYVNLDKLRNLAIKWVKEDIEDYRNADLFKYLHLLKTRWLFDLPAQPVGIKIHNFIVKQRQKWKDRLNITEEDLRWI